MLLTRSEAEQLYAQKIITEGNPLFFIFKYLEKFEDYQIEEMMEEFGIEDIEIIEEEE